MKGTEMTPDDIYQAIMARWYADGAEVSLRRVSEQMADVLSTAEEFVNAVAAARAAEDNWHRSGFDEAMGMGFEDAAATSIIKENALRAVIAKARGA